MSKDDEMVHIQFARAALPSFYKGQTNPRYSIRYSLYTADSMSVWSMMSECGLNRTMLQGRMNDAELDYDAEVGVFSIPLDMMTEESYKVNIIAHVMQQRSGTSPGTTAMYWQTYDVELDMRPADLPYSGPNNPANKPADKSSQGPIVALYVMIPIMFFVVMFGLRYLWKRKQAQAHPIPLELFGVETASDLPYQKVGEKDGVYTNGNGHVNGTNGTNGVHGSHGTNGTNGTSGVNGHDAVHGGVETGEPTYVSNPTAENNFYTQ